MLFDLSAVFSRQQGAFFLRNHLPTSADSPLPFHSFEHGRMRRIMEENLALRGSNREIEMFIYCFYGLMISLLGARSCQAQILTFSPGSKRFLSANNM
jgi:hypothetical protein